MSIDFNGFHNFLKEQHDNKPFNFESQGKGKWESAVQTVSTLNKTYHVLSEVDSNKFTSLESVQEFLDSYVYTKEEANSLVIFDLQERKEIPFKKVKEGDDFKIIILNIDEKF